MPIAVTEDHESLRTTALRWAQTHSPATVPRQAAEAPPGAADLPAAWEKMAAQGWLGLHIPEDQGGQSFTLSELAVVVEELGTRSPPGPLLPTLVVSAAVARGSRGPAIVPAEWVRGLAEGTITAAVALGAVPQHWQPGEEGHRPWRAQCARCSGCPRPGWCWSPRRRHRYGCWCGCGLDPARPGSAG